MSRILILLSAIISIVYAYEAIQITIQNLIAEDLDIFWLDPNTYKRTLITQVKANKEAPLNSYVGHTFKLVKADGTDVATVHVEKDKEMYFVDNFDRGKFRDEYFACTGREWHNVIPREETYHFIWSTPAKGFKHLVHIYPPHWHQGEPEVVQPLQNQFFPREVQFGHLEVFSTSPKILFIHDFLSEDEADYLIEYMKPTLKRSTVSNIATLDENRTSRTTWISHDATPIVQNIVQRAFNLLRIPYNSLNSSKAAESLQGLHYGKEQWYREHYDYFAPKDYKDDAHIQAGNNRLATLFLYLTDVEEGGETYFPRYDSNYVPDGCKNPDCFKVKPRRGAATLFYSMLEDGNFDFDSLHGGCPVMKGDKYAVNLWFWDRNFRG